ncbi:uncharacterized protein LOC134539294 [Bacillus rossius redtenbacheri]|uniref:uncharacterized protein LOC134539294 n=1 Tax=Bacillus rossius redtenbacheri TaxID=93214 RepID=UPI002FDEB763
MSQALEPTWRLDRRDSGHLFWRRDSASPAPSRARVKFRCDVEVLEFWARDDDPSSDDCGDDDEEEHHLKEWRRRRSAPAASSPAVVLAVCLAAVVVTVSLPWLLVR